MLICLFSHLHGTQPALAFIYNFNSSLYYKKSEEVERNIVTYIECYKQVVTFRNTCKDLVAKESFDSMLNHMPFRKYMKSDKELNYFMIDSYFEEERIKSYYKSYENMYDCLDSMDKTFRINYKEINFSTKSKYHNIHHIKGLYEQIKEIVDDLDFILDNTMQTTFQIADKESIYRSIEKNHPLILKAYRVIGRDRLLKDGYSLKNIELMIEESERIYATSNNKVLKHFKRHFHPGQKILQTQALYIFKKIIDSHHIPYSKKLQELAEFVNFKQKKNQKGTRYLLIESVKWS